MMPPLREACLLCASAIILSACSSTGENIAGPVGFEAEGNATTILQSINRAAAKCWIGQPAFKGLGMVPELDTRVGKPRILLLARGNTLPKLVIEASGNPAKVITYGPLVTTALSARINDDVIRWSGGDNSCT